MTTPTVITMHSSAPAASGGYGYAQPSARTASSVRPSKNASMNVTIKASKRAASSSKRTATKKAAKRS